MKADGQKWTFEKSLSNDRYALNSGRWDGRVLRGRNRPQAVVQFLRDTDVGHAVIGFHKTSEYACRHQRRTRSQPLSLFKELKRRNVIRVAIAYAVAAWLLIEITATTFPILKLPDWSVTLVTVLVLIGFPLALILAWAYELTPEGLKKEKDVDRSQSITHVTGRKLDFIIITVLVLALGYFAYDKFLLQPEPGEVFGDMDKSIAVLPFVNMSDDAGNEYFSDGLSEELLNLLVKIPELRVAARTSSFSYKGKDVKIAQIGEELNVTHVLEGSVRKSGDRVRITAQLVKADDGFHLWSKTFDRTLEDIFVVQDEIAKAVVDELKIELLGAMPEGRKTDSEVYSLYLQGKYFNNLRGEENLEKAVAAFKQALAIDPEYAPAWVGIQLTYSLQVAYAQRPEKETRALAMEAAERALAIDENMASAWAALAYLLRTNEWDWQAARVAINKALNLEPNNAEVLPVAASLAGTFGRLSESVALFERNIELDPLRLGSLRALGIRYRRVGRFDDAFEAFRRVQAVNPNYPGIRDDLGATHLLSGDPKNALLEVEKGLTGKFHRYLLTSIHSDLGNEAEAQSMINELLETSAHDVPLLMASVYAWRGEDDSAFEWLEIAYQRHDYRLVHFLGSLWFRNLTADPRYPVFVEKLGLLEEWKAMPPEYGGPSKPPTASGR